MESPGNQYLVYVVSVLLEGSCIPIFINLTINNKKRKFSRHVGFAGKYSGRYDLYIQRPYLRRHDLYQTPCNNISQKYWFSFWNADKYNISASGVFFGHPKVIQSVLQIKNNWKYKIRIIHGQQ
jgi:hypothetical protein